MNYCAKGGSIPLVAKAERLSTMDRRVPLDLVVVPVREQGEVAGIGVHVGLWTRQALSTPAEEVPLLRSVLRELEDEFDLDPKGHSVNAVRHDFSSLPRTLHNTFATDTVNALDLT